MELEKKFKIDSVVNLDVPNNEIVERISDRWTHPGSGRVYSYSYNPPLVEGKDDETGEALIRRSDDEPESVRTRLAAYEENTKPLLDHYKNLSILKNFTGEEHPERSTMNDDAGNEETSNETGERHRGRSVLRTVNEDEDFIAIHNDLVGHDKDDGMEETKKSR